MGYDLRCCEHTVYNEQNVVQTLLCILVKVDIFSGVLTLFYLKTIQNSHEVNIVKCYKAV